MKITNVVIGGVVGFNVLGQLVGVSGLNHGPRAVIFAGDIPVNVHVQQIGDPADFGMAYTAKGLVQQVMKTIFRRHDGVDHGYGGNVVTQTEKVYMTVTNSACLSRETIVEGSTTFVQVPPTNYVVVAQTTSEVVYTGIPSTDVHVVTPTSSTVEVQTETQVVVLNSVLETHTPVAEVPDDPLSTVTDKTTQTIDINVCPGTGCTSQPVTDVFVPQVSTTEVPVVPEVPATTTHSNTLSTITSYTDVTTSTEVEVVNTPSSTGSSQVPPTSTPTASQGARLEVFGRLVVMVIGLVAFIHFVY